MFGGQKGVGMRIFLIITVGLLMWFGSMQTASAVMASGGTVTDANGYRIHTFTTTGSNSLTFNEGGTVEMLIVAGGGGGAGVAAAGGGRGGGGAGGVISTSLVVTTGAKVLYVGAGGNGGTAANSNGVNGANSFFDTITATGGGGGGASGNTGRPGGSGGGGPNGSTGGTGIAGQGYKGGDSGSSMGGGGGGGGASCVGSNAVVTNLGGKGGDGIVSSISGTAIYYGGGGGGGAYQNAPIASGGNGGGGNGGSDSNAAGNATANTGGGGGGSGSKTGGTAHAGGDGGAGIVIVKYILLPSVDNAGGATNITGSSADLNGSLLATGIAPTTVFAFWGSSDGGTNAWANTNVWNAPQTLGTFSQHVTGLDSNTTYYYRYAASNDAGMVWAPSSTVFITGDVWVDKLSDASEIGPTPGTFTVHRVSAATNGTLMVNYAISGTASNGVDYAAMSGAISIPAGTDAVALVVSPYFDHFMEGAETVQVTVVSGAYLVGAASSAVLSIADAGVMTNVWSGGGTNALASNPTNWVAGTIPVAGDAVLLDSTTNKNMTWDLNIPIQSWTQVGYTGTVTMATVYGTSGFTNFNILGDCVISNGIWIHSGPQATEVNRLKVTIGGNLTIGTNASINVSSKGYGYKLGPGKGGDFQSGSYGGRGVGSPGICYGSIVAPTNLGSGAYNGYGGGAILLQVGGILCNDGWIRADGGSEGGNGATASGGSIWLNAGTVTGNGTIRAGGGNAASGGGGGGRISLIITNVGLDFTGTLSACGIGAGGGAAGTIYIEKKGDVPGKGELIVNNASGSTAYDVNTDLSGVAAVTYEFSRITLTNNANLNIGSDDMLVITNTVIVGAGGLNNGISIAGGTLLAPSGLTFSNYFIRIAASSANFAILPGLTIGTNAELKVDQPYAMTGDVTVAAGGKLTHTANGSSEAYKLNLMLNGNLYVLSGGSVDVNGRGYAGNSGPGTHPANYCGGSYGGLGVGGLLCYGSLTAPTNYGSGGRYSTAYAGGGVIQLLVSGVVSNGGRIIANASESTQYSGTGGSIYITAGSLAGAGPIQANSATNVTGSGPGGGGRISLVVTNAGADFSAYPSNMITAFGGQKSGACGGAGTIYLRTAGQATSEGTLIVDNNNQVGLASEISTNVGDTSVGNVILRNRGYLSLATNQTLTVGGVWSNAALFAGQFGSQVIFAGGAASTSTVYGTNLFMGLTCTNGVGKTLLFEAGKTNTIPTLGRLMLKGALATTNLVLRSTVDGLPWKLNVNGVADQSVAYVDVKDSHAGLGVAVNALNSIDNGGNTNWIFMQSAAGDTNIWTGASNTIWSLGANWSQARAPVAEDYVLIPSAMPRYPILDNQKTVNGMRIQSGASLTLGGYDLTFTTNAVVEGTLSASSSETITFQGDVDFTGGNFVANRSTVVFAGTGPQSLSLASQVFFKMVVLNSAAAVGFDNSFTTTEFHCEAASGTLNLVFKQGITLTTRDLILLGPVGATNIFLRSSVPGQKWNLSVVGFRNVGGVDVQDSDASSRLPIPASRSQDSGNNLNWVFGAPVTWLGVSNNNFHTAANWSSGVVPDATTRVLVDSSTALSVTGAVSILDLVVGGNTGAASMTVSAAMTVGENITVLSNGTLILNRPCVVSNGLSVLVGGLLTHSVNGSTEANKLQVSVLGNVAIDLGASVDVRGKGYSYGNGPGAKGSYGGRGTAAGQCYGSIVAPTNCGSGGDTDYGAGAILLNVAGEIKNDGLMCADGSGSRAGSGGSIWLTSGTLVGSGVIRANGGANTPSGGGRISLVVTNAGADFSLFTGTILAAGGGGSAGAGTIYKQRAMDLPLAGTLIVDNNNTSSSGYTDLNPNVADKVVGDLLLRNGAYLLLFSNQTLTVGGVWSNAAYFAGQWGSQVFFSGGLTSTSTVYGTNVFMGLTCTNGGKTLLFQAGKTNTIPAGGRLTWKGSGTTNLILRSTADGTPWKLNVNIAAAQTVERVDVKDSNAMPGLGTEVAAINSQDSGNNSNWSFTVVSTGATNVWTGSSNTVWSARGNWSLNRTPIPDDFITIPVVGTARYPVLDSAVTMQGLDVRSGASLALAGYDLTATASSLLAGSLTASAAETMTFPADVDFSGGSVTAVRSTLALTGTGDQLVNLGNQTFYKVAVLNSAGTVTFNSGFGATELRCEAPSGTRNLVFQEGATVTLRDLVMRGAVGATNITLRSSSSPQKWNLAVSGYRFVRGVDVQDSDASSGLPIPAAASQDSGDNVNWTFDVAPAMWLGVSNSNFHTAANWSSGVVPDAATRVWVDATNAMSITGAVTVLDLVVGGNTGAASVTVTAPLTVSETITVLSNGTLVLNRPCVVSNGLYVLSGGLLTHSANGATEPNKINVTVYGKVGVDVGGSVNVTGKGYASTKGPGYQGSYGGRGTAGGLCYGSIVAPTNCGSGGDYDYGGGAIILNATGEIRNDGLLCADGSSASGRSGSGGTVWLTSGTLIGIGTIRANGGSANPAGGGRISLVVTNTGADFALYTGSVLAFGGNSSAGAGTIYKQIAADRPGRGTVFLNNNGYTSGYTDFPPSTNYVAGEVERTAFYVTNAAIFRLANDLTVGDIWLTSANAQLDLGLKTLIVHSRQHAFSGTVVNWGTIIWMPDVAGTVFSIR